MCANLAHCELVLIFHPMSYTILLTHTVDAPKREARIFATCLAADKGIGSVLVTISPRTVDIVAFDGRAIRYTRE